MTETALELLKELEKSYELSIIKLSSSVTQSEDSLLGANRSSDVSNASAAAGTTPATLAADLVHYKELFSKLRFSYIEQVTKEKFLRALTSDTPLFIEPHENAQLEAQLAEEKVALKEQKEEVAKLTQELESKGRSLAQRYEAIELQKATIADLPNRIADLESTVQALREAYPSPAKADDSNANSKPHLNLPLPATLSLLDERRDQLSELDERIAQLQAVLPQRACDLDRLEAELRPLQGRKKEVVALAREARERKEKGGMDELERHGRWCRAADVVMREILDMPA